MPLYLTSSKDSVCLLNHIVNPTNHTAFLLNNDIHS
jgi:hypothetical protein